MPDCPTPKRAIYATEGAAWRVLTEARLLITRVPYRCIAGHWHLAPRAEALRHRTAGR